MFNLYYFNSIKNIINFLGAFSLTILSKQSRNEIHDVHIDLIPFRLMGRQGIFSFTEPLVASERKKNTNINESQKAHNNSRGATKGQ